MKVLEAEFQCEDCVVSNCSALERSVLKPPFVMLCAGPLYLFCKLREEYRCAKCVENAS